MTPASARKGPKGGPSAAQFGSVVATFYPITRAAWNFANVSNANAIVSYEYTKKRTRCMYSLQEEVPIVNNRAVATYRD